MYAKQGKRGKAESLIEGFGYARYETIAMIDADLQYPPEAIPAMVEKLHHGADIIVANRTLYDTDILRSFLSKAFVFFFARLLHNLRCDSQSGLKVFRKKILREVILDPTPWTFDMEFLLSARNYGYVIDTVNISFADRQAGVSKLNPLRAILEIGWSALRLKWKGRPPLLIHPENIGNKKGTMLGAGVAHNRQRFITHTTLHHKYSALNTFAPWQRNFILGVFLLVVFGLFLNPLYTGISMVALLTAIYFIDALFNLFLVMKSLKTPPEITSSPEELTNISEDALPVYSVLCPLYKEAHMLPTFVAAMQNLDWPKNKLDVLLLLEENDPETIAAAQAMDLPEYVRIVVVPHSMPKTKPKACNYGLAFASGEYVVIYDAEDIPEPLQLKKAYLGFQKAHPAVRCLQAKLNYFNPHQNLLTRLFTAEYSLWFDVILPGLQSINTSIPLGGTSNHFRTQDLLELEGWDPFNVTEDCDLGVRLFKRGYQTAIIDSLTLEEANSDLKNWIRQRSRWIKGYMQTYLVHMRHPVAFARDNGWHALIFQLVVGGKISFLFINPFLWLATLSYFILYAFVGPAIEALYPPAVFYMGVASLIFGNFLYLYYYMIGTVKREHYSVVKYVFLVPFYWILISTAAIVALYQLISKPHYWEKTVHGLFQPGNKWVDSLILKDSIPAMVPRVSFFKKLNPFAPVQKGWAGILQAIRQRVPPALWNFTFSNKGVLMVSLVFSNFLNFVFNAFLGRILSFEALSLVTLMNTIWFFVMLIIGAFSSTVNHRTSYLIASGDTYTAHHFLRSSLRVAFSIAIGISLVWVIATPLLMSFFNLGSVVALLFFTPVFGSSVLLAGYRGFLQGNLSFIALSALFVGESLLKLVIAVIFVFAGYSALAYLSIPLSIVGIAVVAFIVTRIHLPRPAVLVASEDKQFPFPFFSASLLTGLSTMAFLSVDIFLVNHYFEPVIAGQYALLSLVGKMIYFLGSLPNFFTLTFVSRNDGLKKSSTKVFQFIYGFTLFVVVCGVLLLGVFGSYTLPFLFGPKALAIIPWLLPYTGAIAFFTLTGVTISYHLAKRQYVFSVASLGIAIAMIVGIMLSHQSITAIVRVIFVISVFGWTALWLLHIFYRDLRFVRRAIRDLVGVFFNGLPTNIPPLATGKKRVLIFNWRDTTHKFAGGAEMYVHEIAKGWVKEGNQALLFCGNDGGQKRYETIDGIRVVRRGGFYLVYLWAFLYYIFRFRGQYDIVIDCENGVPFFTPLYVHKPIFCLLHHVHQDVFRHSLPRLLAAFAQFLEKDLMPFIYWNVKFITVSESSREDMEKLGIGTAGIQVINPGVNLSEYSSVLAEKTSYPTILYLGRLKAYKSIDVLIRAFQMVIKEQPEAKLIIAGSGEEEKHLERLARELGLNDSHVRFIGRVSDENKVKLLQSAWVFVNPSFREGWGIVNIEANAAGTPVIASDVPGLRDSVKNNETGYLVEYGDSKAFSDKILEVIRNRELCEGLSQEAKVWSQGFSWKKASALFYEALH